MDIVVLADFCGRFGEFLEIFELVAMLVGPMK